MKRILVFSDGTWSDPEKEIPTNIYKLATCISHEWKGVEQLVFYDPGVGTEVSFLERMIQGAFGNGIDLNIQQLYTFLAMNYVEGDEIMLFGFSRGAYTVRSLAGMMREVGLVRRHKLDQVKDAYELYRNNVDPESDAAKKFREEHSRRVPIKLVGCFDTVGALGLPEGMASKSSQQKYQFHDTTLSSDIEHAVHLVSIDEALKTFKPTLMKGKENQLTQLFLPGGHGGVGGGTKEEQDLSNNALLVMVEECEKRCDIGIEKTLLPQRFVKNVPFTGETSPIDRFLRFFTAEYYREIPSVDVLHSSVFDRFQNVKEWRPAALDKFRDALLNAKK